MSHLQQALDALRATPSLVDNVTEWRTLGDRAAQYRPIPKELDQRLVQYLSDRAIDQLYLHQSQAIKSAWRGENVVVVTPTASGKTLCYNLPVWQTLLTEPDTRALYLFPTKALGHDQLDTLQEPRAIANQVPAATYDGDTPRSRRSRLRNTARIILSNPDMLHTGILPYHTQWHEFFAHLSFIVLDEMHSYRGIFGSHVANVVRRLKRICRFHGSDPQFICCSATIANPGELGRRLIEDKVTVVDENGAPQSRRSFLFYNPPFVDQRLGLRRSPLGEARILANLLLKHDVQTVVFCQSRAAVEQLLIYLRQDAEQVGLDPSLVQSYRSGYLAHERRAIERGLRDGSVRVVVATSALELGIDIGGLDACVMVGYPGTIASTWQRAGRTGRGQLQSAAILIASSAALDQYMILHPDYFFQQSAEHALLNPNNLSVMLQHTQSALYELPMSDDEIASRPKTKAESEDTMGEILSYLSDQHIARYARDRWFWVGQGYPAGETSLRTADPKTVTIQAQSGEWAQVIGQVERSAAPRMVHPGAVYLHQGRQYTVDELNLEDGLAQVKQATVDYYTEATSSQQIRIESTRKEIILNSHTTSLGEIKLTHRVTGYRRLRLGTLEFLSWDPLELPEQIIFTTASWTVIADELVEQMREEGLWTGEDVQSRGPNWETQRNLARQRDGYVCQQCGAPERPGQAHHVHHVVPFREFRWVPGKNDNYRQANNLSNLLTLCPTCHQRVEQQVALQSTLSSMARVVRHVLPIYLMCDPHDIGVLTQLRATQTKRPTLFIYDSIPGGAGLCDEVMELFPQILSTADELIADCPCDNGCPSCVGPLAIAGYRAKEKVRRLIAALQA